MHDFLEKLIKIVLPRIRDFRGVSSKSFDLHGNLTIGIPEHTVFPEVDLAKISKVRGLEITIVIKNSDPEKSRKFLEELGMPFENTQKELKDGQKSKN
jgi:large subunit ribosomal protein L5